MNACSSPPAAAGRALSLWPPGTACCSVDAARCLHVLDCAGRFCSSSCMYSKCRSIGCGRIRRIRAGSSKLSRCRVARGCQQTMPKVAVHDIRSLLHRTSSFFVCCVCIPYLRCMYVRSFWARASRGPRGTQGLKFCASGLKQPRTRIVLYLHMCSPDATSIYCAAVARCAQTRVRPARVKIVPGARGRQRWNSFWKIDCARCCTML